MVLSVVCVAVVTSCQPNNADSDASRPLFEVLEDIGYRGSGDDWAEALQDDQRAALDIAYDASTESGYEGSFADWMEDKVLARRDSGGDVVVLLPDGAEFTLPRNTNADDGFVRGDRGEKSQMSNADESGSVISADRLSSEKSAGVKGEGKQTEGGGADSNQSSSGDGGSAAGAPGDERPAMQEEAPEEQGQVMADAGAHLIVDDVKANPGDGNVRVSVRVSGNPGMLGLTFSLSFDESVLTLVSAENGEAIKGILSLTRSRSLGTGCTFTWDGLEIDPSEIRDGSVLNLTFAVADKATSGIYPIAIRGISALSNDLTDIALTAEDGSVQVQ